ncbi:MAG TPA: hypothetical protein VLS93_07175 [Anaeromyxobacteraceae bacterium]|nr:hypothetical protein [Anaeromyxobacteraceae bacterium]
MVPVLVLALAAAAPGEAGRVVERVVAVVRIPNAPPRPITLTELTEEARIALVGHGAVAAAFQPLDREALRAALDGLVDQMLVVADEAARRRAGQVEREALLAEMRRFRGQFPSQAEYARFLEASEITEEDLAVVLERGLRVRRYLESRVGPWSRVSEEEVDRYLAERGADRTSEAARDAVRTRLVQQKVTAQVKQLLADLRARAEIRLLPGEGEEGG